MENIVITIMNYRREVKKLKDLLPSLENIKNLNIIYEERFCEREKKSDK